ncbi:hypothetical protein C0585_06840 [Candidatus Woesearchaeota archaeon]|nr:MAG: hypothetical protein C0585_06840 [Candidatus Woesearchaeota archaeon]
MNVSKIIFDKLFIQGCSMKTITAYELQLEKFLEWVDKPPLKVKQKDIEEYTKYLRRNDYAHSSIRLSLNAIKYYFVKIMKRRFEISMPKKHEKHTGVCDRNEIVEAIDNLRNPKHKLLLALLYGSGVRVSEAVKIRHDDIFDDYAVIRQGKGSKDRKIIVSDIFLELYEPFKKRKGFVFNGRNSHLTVRSVQEIVKKAFKDRHVHPHMLRASFATHLYESSVDKHKIQRLLGHKDVRTVEVYTKYSKFDPEVKSPLDI